MSKKESNFVSMVLSLLIITLVSGLSLGFINDLTAGPKAKAKLEKKIKALKLVLPAFDNNPVKEVSKVISEQGKDSIELYPAFAENNFIGAAVIGSSEKGFSGLVKIMIGFTEKGKIENIEVLEQKETPGLGTKMKGEKFLKQFRGIDPTTYNLKVKKDGGDIDALTGATITSRAFGEAVQMGYDEFVENKETLKNSKN